MLSEEEINLWNAQNEQTARSARGSRHSKSSGHGSRQPSSVGSHPASFKGPPPMAPMAPSKVPSAKKSAVTRRGVKKVRGTSVWSKDEEDSDEEGSDEEGSDEEDSDEEDSDEEGSDEEGSDEEDSDEEDLDQEDSDEEHLSVSNHKNKRDDTRARTDPHHKRSPPPDYKSKRDDTRARKDPRHERSPPPDYKSKRDDTRARKDPRHERSPPPDYKSKRDDTRARKEPRHERSPAPSHKSKRDDIRARDSGEEDSGEEDSGEEDSSASNHKSGKGDGRARDSHYKGSVTSNHGSKQNKGRARDSDHFEKRDGESKNEMPQEPSSMKNGDQPRNSNPHGGPRGDDRKSVHADSVNGDTKSQKSTQFKANTPGWIRETKKPSKSIAGDSKKSPKSVVGYTRDRVGSSRSKSNHGDGKRDDDKSQKGGESGKRDIGKSPESIKDGGRDGKRDDDKSQRGGESGKKDTGKRDTGKSPESIKDGGRDGKKGASSSADKSRASPLKDIQEDSEGSEELDPQRADARRPKNSATIASDTPSKEPEKPKRKGEYTRKTVPKGAKVISPTRGFARKPRPEDARWAWIDPKVKVDSKKRAEDWGYGA
ncbi:hypothetical protein ABEW05_008610 [Botrytis cinerea]